MCCSCRASHGLNLTACIHTVLFSCDAVLCVSCIQIMESRWTLPGLSSMFMARVPRQWYCGPRCGGSWDPILSFYDVICCHLLLWRWSLTGFTSWGLQNGHLLISVMPYLYISWNTFMNNNFSLCTVWLADGTTHLGKRVNAWFVCFFPFIYLFSEHVGH